jgi:catechol 2,3-dioxygenase-like lactoylglutathione lyase family enzyme
MTFHMRLAAITLPLALGVSASALAQSAAENPPQLSPPRTVTLVVADLAKEVEWYGTVLGFQDTHQFGKGRPDADNRAIRIALNGFRLDLVWHRGSTRPPPPALYQEGYSHISFETTEIDRSYTWLTAHHIPIDAVRDPKTQGLKILRFHDPEGNEIHIELPN